MKDTSTLKKSYVAVKRTKEERWEVPLNAVQCFE